MKKLLAFIFALAFGAPALGQDGPNHSVPIFGGPGFVGFKSAGPCAAGQVLSWPSSSVDPVCVPATGTSTVSVNVMNFGCVGDGTTDDTTCIQNAINALPASGGNVIFPGNKNYKITSALILGDGSVSAQSTKNGIVLQGEGNPTSDAFFGGLSASPAKITWGGSVGGTILFVAGPLQGWGINNLYLDCASTADIGAKLQSAQHGNSANFTLANCRSRGLITDAVANSSIGDTNTENNGFYNLNIVIPNIANAVGLILDGGTAPFPTDADFNTFINLQILQPLTATATTAIILKNSDSNVFITTYIFGGGAGSTGVSFDYTGVTTAHPASNVFFGLDVGINNAVKFSNNGAPGAAKPNYIYGLIETNGVTSPNLANLAVSSSNRIVFSPGGNTFNTLIAPTGASGSAATFTLPATSGNAIISSAGMSTNALLYASGAATVATDRCTMDSNSTISCTSATAFQPQFQITQTANDTSSGFFNFQKNRAAGNTNNGDQLGAFIWKGFANAGQQNTAQIVSNQTAASSGSNIPSKLELSTSNTAGQLNQILRFDQAGHMSVVQSAAAPAATSCGTSPTTRSGSTDAAGEVTTGTGTPTTCTITFGTAFAAAPFCTVTSQTQLAAFAYTISTTAISVTNTATSSDKINWICIGA